MTTSPLEPLRLCRALPLLAVLGAGVVAGCGGSGGVATAAGPPPRTAQAPAPAPVHPATTRTRLTAKPAAALGNGTAVLRVRLSGPVAPGSPHPRITPDVAGSWEVMANNETFTPTSTLQPCTSYHLTIPARTQAVGHHTLGHARTLLLRVACPTTNAVQHALARLGYLPYQVRGRASGAVLAGAESRRDAADQAFGPSGRLHHSIPGAPRIRVGAVDPVTRGAIMAFQTAHGMAADGVVTATTWRSLLADETTGHRAGTPYTWVDVSKRLPERLVVHRGRHAALTAAANTGVPGAETADGTFPVFLRLEVTTMRGTNPDGSKYDDPGVRWVSYFNGGDAVHGFPRGSYGSPQSVGCVELGEDDARRVYAMLGIGDPVVVHE